jgi:RHS repeat-associated protein
VVLELYSEIRDVNTGSIYQFMGQELDGTGVYNFRARMYDTSAAIFYVVDPANQGFRDMGIV